MPGEKLHGTIMPTVYAVGCAMVMLEGVSILSVIEKTLVWVPERLETFVP